MGGGAVVSDWSACVGREETRHDRVDPGQVARWLATLDRDAASDGTIPQGFHWCLCLPDAPIASLGPDGHPRRDDSPASFLPPLPQPRRMWASSKVEFFAPLRAGQAIERLSRVQAVTEKNGDSGSLVFVDVAHEMRGDGVLAVREVQTLVYRDTPPPGTPLAPPELSEGTFDPSSWTAVLTITPSEPLLFRFSALTFNSHRIHYDLPYATQQEGYRGGKFCREKLFARWLLGEVQSRGNFNKSVCSVSCSYRRCYHAGGAVSCRTEWKRTRR